MVRRKTLARIRQMVGRRPELCECRKNPSESIDTWMRLVLSRCWPGMRRDDLDAFERRGSAWVSSVWRGSESIRRA